MAGAGAGHDMPVVGQFHGWPGPVLVMVIQNLLDAQVSSHVPALQLLGSGVGQVRLPPVGVAQQVVAHLMQQNVGVLLVGPLLAPLRVDVESPRRINAHGGNAIIEDSGHAGEVAAEVLHPLHGNVLCLGHRHDMGRQLDTGHGKTPGKEGVGLVLQNHGSAAALLRATPPWPGVDGQTFMICASKAPKRSLYWRGGL